jgi:hypothetical protein
METEIDSSINIFPLSLMGGIPGLLFAPVSFVLPRGSFQIEAGLLFGRTSVGERAFSSLPFEAGLRLAPIKHLEIAAVFNAAPKFSGDAGWGFSGSARWEFLHPQEDLPLGMAVGISYAWAQNGGEAPLSPGRGGGLYLPLVLALSPVSLIFSPGMRWIGPDEPTPHLLLSAGALYQGSWFIAGPSLRSEFNFSDTGDLFKLMMGGEFKIYPPPSNLVFSLLGGAWIQGSSAGGFGGIGIGVLY